jgi:hypothetical protein
LRMVASMTEAPVFIEGIDSPRSFPEIFVGMEKWFRQCFVWNTDRPANRGGLTFGPL